MANAAGRPLLSRPAPIRPATSHPSRRMPREPGMGKKTVVRRRNAKGGLAPLGYLIRLLPAPPVRHEVVRVRGQLRTIARMANGASSGCRSGESPAADWTWTSSGWPALAGVAGFMHQPWRVPHTPGIRRGAAGEARSTPWPCHRASAAARPARFRCRTAT